MNISKLAEPKKIITLVVLQKTDKLWILYRKLN